MQELNIERAPSSPGLPHPLWAQVRSMLCLAPLLRDPYLHLLPIGSERALTYWGGVRWAGSHHGDLTQPGGETTGAGLWGGRLRTQHSCTPVGLFLCPGHSRLAALCPGHLWGQPCGRRWGRQAVLFMPEVHSILRDLFRVPPQNTENG